MAAPRPRSSVLASPDPDAPPARPPPSAARAAPRDGAGAGAAPGGHGGLVRSGAHFVGSRLLPTPMGATGAIKGCGTPPLCVSAPREAAQGMSAVAGGAYRAPEAGKASLLLRDAWQWMYVPVERNLAAVRPAGVNGELEVVSAAAWCKLANKTGVTKTSMPSTGFTMGRKSITAGGALVLMPRARMYTTTTSRTAGFLLSDLTVPRGEGAFVALAGLWARAGRAPGTPGAVVDARNSVLALMDKADVDLAAQPATDVNVQAAGGKMWKRATVMSAVYLAGGVGAGDDGKHLVPRKPPGSGIWDSEPHVTQTTLPSTEPGTLDVTVKRVLCAHRGDVRAIMEEWGGALLAGPGPPPASIAFAAAVVESSRAVLRAVGDAGGNNGFNNIGMGPATAAVHGHHARGVSDAMQWLAPMKAAVATPWIAAAEAFVAWFNQTATSRGAWVAEARAVAVWVGALPSGHPAQNVVSAVAAAASTAKVVVPGTGGRTVDIRSVPVLVLLVRLLDDVTSPTPDYGKVLGKVAMPFAAEILQSLGVGIAWSHAGTGRADDVRALAYLNKGVVRGPFHEETARKNAFIVGAHAAMANYAHMKRLTGGGVGVAAGLGNEWSTWDRVPDTTLWVGRPLRRGGAAGFTDRVVAAFNEVWRLPAYDPADSTELLHLRKTRDALAEWTRKYTGALYSLVVEPLVVDCDPAAAGSVADALALEGDCAPRPPATVGMCGGKAWACPRCNGATLPLRHGGASSTPAEVDAARVQTLHAVLVGTRLLESFYVHGLPRNKTIDAPGVGDLSTKRAAEPLSRADQDSDVTMPSDLGHWSKRRHAAISKWHAIGGQTGPGTANRKAAATRGAMEASTYSGTVNVYRNQPSQTFFTDGGAEDPEEKTWNAPYKGVEHWLRASAIDIAVDMVQAAVLDPWTRAVAARVSGATEAGPFSEAASAIGLEQETVDTRVVEAHSPSPIGAYYPSGSFVAHFFPRTVPRGLRLCKEAERQSTVGTFPADKFFDPRVPTPNTDLASVASWTPPRRGVQVSDFKTYDAVQAVYPPPGADGKFAAPDDVQSVVDSKEAKYAAVRASGTTDFSRAYAECIWERNKCRLARKTWATRADIDALHDETARKHAGNTPAKWMCLRCLGVLRAPPVSGAGAGAAAPVPAPVSRNLPLDAAEEEAKVEPVAAAAVPASAPAGGAVATMDLEMFSVVEEPAPVRGAPDDAPADSDDDAETDPSVGSPVVGPPARGAVLDAPDDASVYSADDNEGAAAQASGGAQARLAEDWKRMFTTGRAETNRATTRAARHGGTRSPTPRVRTEELPHTPSSPVGLGPDAAPASEAPPPMPRVDVAPVLPVEADADAEYSDEELVFASDGDGGDDDDDDDGGDDGGGAPLRLAVDATRETRPTVITNMGSDSEADDDEVGVGGMGARMDVTPRSVVTVSPATFGAVKLNSAASLVVVGGGGFPPGYPGGREVALKHLERGTCTVHDVPVAVVVSGDISDGECRLSLAQGAGRSVTPNADSATPVPYHYVLSPTFVHSVLTAEGGVARYGAVVYARPAVAAAVWGVSTHPAATLYCLDMESGELASAEAMSTVSSLPWRPRVGPVEAPFKGRIEEVAVSDAATWAAMQQQASAWCRWAWTPPTDGSDAAPCSMAMRWTGGTNTLVATSVPDGSLVVILRGPPGAARAWPTPPEDAPLWVATAMADLARVGFSTSALRAGADDCGILLVNVAVFMATVLGVKAPLANRDDPHPPKVVLGERQPSAGMRRGIRVSPMELRLDEALGNVNTMLQLALMVFTPDQSGRWTVHTEAGIRVPKLDTATAAVPDADVARLMRTTSPETAVAVAAAINAAHFPVAPGSGNTGHSGVWTLAFRMTTAAIDADVATLVGVLKGAWTRPAVDLVDAAHASVAAVVAGAMTEDTRHASPAEQPPWLAPVDTEMLGVAPPPTFGAPVDAGPAAGRWTPLGWDPDAPPGPSVAAFWPPPACVAAATLGLLSGIAAPATMRHRGMEMTLAPRAVFRRMPADHAFAWRAVARCTVASTMAALATVPASGIAGLRSAGGPNADANVIGFAAVAASIATEAAPAPAAPEADADAEGQAPVMFDVDIAGDMDGATTLPVKCPGSLILYSTPGQRMGRDDSDGDAPPASKAGMLTVALLMYVCESMVPDVKQTGAWTAAAPVFSRLLASSSVDVYGTSVTAVAPDARQSLWAAFDRVFRAVPLGAEEGATVVVDAQDAASLLTTFARVVGAMRASVGDE